MRYQTARVRNVGDVASASVIHSAPWMLLRALLCLTALRMDIVT